MIKRALCYSPLLVAAALGCGKQQEPATAPEPIVVSAPPRPLEIVQAEIDTILGDPAFANAHWGVMIQSVETGEILYRHNQRKLLMPASNMKLVTGSAALARLGADHRFRTSVATCGSLDSVTGTLSGDLLVVGGGDPAISERFSADEDPLSTFRAWADSLQALGITRISGHIIGDDNLFDDVHISPGWSWDYLGAAYAAEIGALLFNEGALGIRFAAGAEVGDTAQKALVPNTSYVTLHGDAVTTADSTGVSVYAWRRPFANDVDVGGEIWIGQDSRTRYVAPFDPTMYFVTVLHETLVAEGVAVSGTAGDRDTVPPPCDSPTTLFVHESPELAEVLKPFMKESQNQIGEMLLRYLGAVQTDTGSVAAGRRAVAATLTDWGIPDDSYIYYDGSGLSRYNYLAPEAVVRILRAMARESDFNVFYDALPIAGVDGTLEGRMRGSRAENNARAKTGFISNARALSGYVTTSDDELLAFSIIANNFDTQTRPVEWVQDLIVERLANFRRDR
jgi:D-alanyl-D-alanine carboxypeptidase/D-alanyl-D-alanine-endopeptidase (penicillin-binding protein 4)